MKLIEYSNYQIRITDEALLVKPIRNLYQKDKSVDKEKFLEQMSILYFYADPRSAYSYIIDDDERLSEIKKQEGLSNNYVLSNEMIEAIKIYKKLIETTSLQLLKNTRITVDKLGKFLRDIDLNETDNKGQPKYTISSVTSALRQVPQLAKDLIATEKLVAGEIEEGNRARKGSDMKVFENGIDL